MKAPMIKVIKSLLLLTILLVSSCTSLSWNMLDPNFEAQNFPVREVRTVIFKDLLIPQSLGDALISEANLNLESQAGIRLKVIEWNQGDSSWILKSVFKIEAEMKQQLKDRNDYDIAIALTHQTPLGFLMSSTVGWISGYTDDQYRRFIVLREKNPWILEHELWHCFIFSHDHSWNGIMSPVGMRLLPLTPTIPIGGRHITEKQRKEVLRNKWRDFTKPPRDEEGIEKAITQSRIDWSRCIYINH